MSFLFSRRKLWHITKKQKYLKNSGIFVLLFFISKFRIKFVERKRRRDTANNANTVNNNVGQAIEAFKRNDHHSCGNNHTDDSME
jgi:hypothetical protein